MARRAAMQLKGHHHMTNNPRDLVEAVTGDISHKA